MASHQKRIELAERHIKEIQADRLTDKDSRNARDLHRAVDLLSKELYQIQTHFLLELLQNADDNTYKADVIPNLTVTYADNYLQTECNEVGFTEENVEAICQIGQSTKRGENKNQGYIGEKGIGFKSVFKVATVVWIHSLEYSFKFDSTKRLGMITPLWAVFPQSTPQGGTAMCFQLSEHCDKKRLLQEITSFDANVLVFLRTLKQVTLNVNGDFHRVLRRKEGNRSETMSTVKILEDNKEILDYIIIKHTVQDMPDDEKRHEISQSDILLAFPNTDSPGQSEKHQVYAFLPIRDYGFKFLLQADLLLVTNREDIDWSRDWNIKLRESIPEAFVEAIRHLSNTSQCYKWLKYVPRRSELGGFFECTTLAIVERLRKESILQSESGLMKPPSSLTYVPKSFYFDNKPLTLNAETKSKYLNCRYLHDNYDQLKYLQVKVMDFGQFLADLQVHLSKHVGSKREPQYEWNTRLAKILIPEFIRRQAIIKSLPLILLDDGRWVSAIEARGKLYFPRKIGMEAIPQALPFMMIDPRSLSGPRRELFKMLGAKDIDDAKVCDAIIKVHSSHTTAPSLPYEVVRSHAIFLFKSDWQNRKQSDFWIPTESGHLQKSSEVYLTDLELDLVEKPPVLLKSFKAFESDHQKKWDYWLWKELHLCTAPRLVNSLGENFEMSGEMTYIRNSWPSARFLQLLKEHWDLYSEWVEERACNGKSHAWRASRDRIHYFLSSTKVACRDTSELVPLNRCVLPPTRPGADIQVKDIEVQILDIPNHKDSSWKFLHHLGVKEFKDIDVFIKILQGLSGSEPKEEVVRSLYDGIQESFYENHELVKQCFASESLIYVPSRASTDKRSRWLSNPSCVWNGPRFLKQRVVLQKIWPGHHKLFHKALEIKNADIGTLVVEAQTITSRDTTDYIAQIFCAISEKLEQSDESREVVKGLQDHEIFPVKLYDQVSDSSIPDFKLCRLNDVWFIADNTLLYKKFLGSLPFLAFDVDQLTNMTCIIDTIDLNGRRLSKVAVKTPITKGEKVPSQTYSDLLYPRWEFIARLVQDPALQEDFDQKLRNIKFYTVDDVQVQWQVPLPSGKVITSQAQSISATSLSKRGISNVYIAKRSIRAHQRVPYELLACLLRLCDIPPEHTGLFSEILSIDTKELNDLLGFYYIPRLRKKTDLSEFQENDADDDNAVDSDAKIQSSQDQTVQKPLANNPDSIDSSRFTPEDEKEQQQEEEISQSSQSSSSATRFRNRDLDSIDSSLFTHKDEKEQQQEEKVGQSSQNLGSTSRSRKKEDLEPTDSSPFTPQDEKEQQQEEEVSQSSQNLGSATRSGNKDLESTDATPSMPNITRKTWRETDIPQPRSKKDEKSSDMTPAQQLKYDRLAPLSKSLTVLSSSTFFNSAKPLNSNFKPFFRPQAESKQQEHAISNNIAETASKPTRTEEVHDQPGFIAYMRSLKEGNKKVTISGQANMIFVPTPDGLPELNSGTRGGLTVLPACMELSDTYERTIFIALNPTRAVDHESEFLGQVFVSQLLNILLENYKPETHWTCTMRSQLGHLPFKELETPTATFTVDRENSAPMTEFLLLQSYKQAELWKGSQPVYHIDVHTTIKDWKDPVTLSLSKLEMAGNFSTINREEPPRDVFIIVRVSEILAEKPKIFILIDPWMMFSTHQLKLKYQRDSTVHLIPSFPPQIQVGELESIRADLVRRQEPQIPQSITDDSYSGRGGFPKPLSPIRKREPFAWQPLSEQNRAFRLLQLFSGKGTEELQAKLEHCSLNESPQYVALSYAWGSNLRPFNLKTNLGIIPLTAAIYLGLRRLRNETKDIYIWADAICIDQDNDREKPQQIRLLSDIFKTATHVFAWLGEEYDQSSAAIDTLRRLVEDTADKEDGSARRSGQGMKIPPVEDPIWDAIIKILERTWFRRVWIIQELVLAREVTLVCGDRKIPWETFYAAIELCFEHAKMPGFEYLLSMKSTASVALELGKFRSLSRKNGEFVAQDTLLNLLEVFNLAKSTKYRDKLFALLSLANDADEEELNPDYKVSLREVVERYARVFVKRGQAMDLLYRARVSTSGERFPSWIPDWTTGPYPETISTWGCRTGDGNCEFAKSGRRCSAHSGCFKAATRFGVEAKVKAGGLLYVQGAVVDTIIERGDCDSSTNDTMDYIREIFQFITDKIPDHVEQEIVKASLPIGGASNPSREKWPGDDRLNAYQALLNYLKPEVQEPLDKRTEPLKLRSANQVLDSPTVPNHIRRELWPFLVTALDFAELLSTAVVCATKQGRVGLVPTTAKEGDLIALFYGSRVPFIIRQSNEHTSEYNLIGECYIHGLMQGEWFHDKTSHEGIQIRLV
ncbi:hypothetical protein ASPZODRAFT_2071477 [Penicilliopsis zonata CBS 506.65]|uniref:Heterokaryon incompatibility domain-containing protein n=1 Tax=Penicilliopsis zonata CBS 506.65 TaxID=1073090 RepID=A0A1L9SGA1_9EURO|nr:hypothetical protein ASPZODRAFT_2071477 [Penicilliopsis zonata CBS 506.65]OJJ46186.1 hypothetical protein ASPZODRAFT_2071477 [Penicilliopsis zonata CBS 506.65]